MQHACICMFERPGSYWHMLPLQTQVRKAIWKAVNPRTGRRRIDDIFPDAYFKKNDSEMLVTSKVNASTWQCMGSDNFQGAIGSSTVGIVYSEWAQANPLARGFFRPIIRDNNGWQIFITTPRGKNHAHKTYLDTKMRMNRGDDAFAQILTIHDTGALTPDQLLEELHEYVSTYGEEYGLALYLQEYECDFNAAVIGAYYGAEFRKIDQQGRITEVPHNPDWPVHVAMDIGRSDDTSIWWWQVVDGRPRIIEHFTASGLDPDAVCSILKGRRVAINLIGDLHEHKTTIEVEYGDDMPDIAHRRAYNYGSINIPHDGAAKTFVAKGKTVQEQFSAVFGWSKILVVPNLSIQDGIQASRKLLNSSEIDHNIDLEAMRQYQRKWDEVKMMFSEAPLHNWSSHSADGFRYMAITVTHDIVPRETEELRTYNNFDELIAINKRKRLREA